MFRGTSGSCFVSLLSSKYHYIDYFNMSLNGFSLWLHLENGLVAMSECISTRFCCCGKKVGFHMEMRVWALFLILISEISGEAFNFHSYSRHLPSPAFLQRDSSIVNSFIPSVDIYWVSPLFRGNHAATGLRQGRKHVLHSAEASIAA